MSFARVLRQLKLVTDIHLDDLGSVVAVDFEEGQVLGAARRL
jgi:hypothetical protein